MSEITIALPVRLNSYGKIESTRDQSKIWQDRVLQVIATQIGERVMRQNFGTYVASEAFDTSESAKAKVEAEITKAFVKSLPTLTLTDTNLMFDTDTSQLLVEITYNLPNTVTDSVVIGLTAVSGRKPPYQENL